MSRRDTEYRPPTCGCVDEYADWHAGQAAYNEWTMWVGGPNELPFGMLSRRSQVKWTAIGLAAARKITCSCGSV